MTSATTFAPEDGSNIKPQSGGLCCRNNAHAFRRNSQCSWFSVNCLWFPEKYSTVMVFCRMVYGFRRNNQCCMVFVELFTVFVEQMDIHGVRHNNCDDVAGWLVSCTIREPSPLTTGCALLVACRRFWNCRLRSITAQKADKCEGLPYRINDLVLFHRSSIYSYGTRTLNTLAGRRTPINGQRTSSTSPRKTKS